MSSNFNGITDVTLQKLCDKILTCVRSNANVAPAAAPNAWKDRLGKQLGSDIGTEVTLTIRVSANAGWIKVACDEGAPGLVIEGKIDVPTLAAILA